MKRRQQKRKQARRVQHARATRTPDRSALMISAANFGEDGHVWIVDHRDDRISEFKVSS